MQGTYLIDSANPHVARDAQRGTIASRASDAAVVTRFVVNEISPAVFLKEIRFAEIELTCFFHIEEIEKEAVCVQWYLQFDLVAHVRTEILKIFTSQ